MSTLISGPVYRLHTKRLVIRCFQPADAPLLKAAIDASLEHLRPWMPWTKYEPEDLQAKIERLRQFRANFDLGRDFVYGIFSQDEQTVLGSTGLHPRVGEAALEIGYWIHVDHLNQGIATEAAGALTRVAFEIHSVKRVEIHCAPNNARSAAVPKKLGFVHEATLRQRDVAATGERRDTMIWTLLIDEYPSSLATGVEIEAFDVVGRRLL